MADVYLQWNTDLAADAKGDLLLADGREQINQRIVRRLLTNAGDYLWNLSYGGSLALAVGAPVDAAHVEATVRRQLEFEAAVPAPLVSVKMIDRTRGAVSLDITYSDSVAGGPATLSIIQS